MTTTIPEGFTAIDEPGTFLGHIGGLHWRVLGEGVETCLVLEPKHTNPLGVAHGGLLMTMLDITLGATAHTLLQRSGGASFPLTVQQSCSFLRAARVGALLCGEAKADAIMRSQAFVSGRLHVDGETVATAAGVFRIPAAPMP